MRKSSRNRISLSEAEDSVISKMQQLKLPREARQEGVKLMVTIGHLQES